MWTYKWLLIHLMLVPQLAESYCAGYDPDFTAPPEVTQVTLTSVLVNWQGLVTRIECADQFIVKWWRTRYPNDYQLSDLLPLTQFSYLARDIVPNQDYIFQAVAREDKGLLGKTWNKSPKAYFRTTTSNPTVNPITSTTNPTNILHNSGINHFTNKKPFGTISLIALVIGSLLVLLILIGILWNSVQSCKRRHRIQRRESVSDSLDLDLENTDLESRVGGSKIRIESISGRTISPWSDSGRGNTYDIESIKRSKSIADEIKQINQVQGKHYDSMRRQDRSRSSSNVSCIRNSLQSDKVRTVEVLDTKSIDNQMSVQYSKRNRSDSPDSYGSGGSESIHYSTKTLTTSQ